MSMEAMDVEKATLDRLRQEYKTKGYKFMIEPSRESLPGFLEGLRPDALALSQGDNVVIEVKRRRSQDSSSMLSHIAKIVSAEPG